jgi:hypothetical protein
VKPGPLTGFGLRLAHLDDFAEISFEFVHPSLEPSAIHFELSLATTLTSSDATTLTGKRLTPTTQARKSITDLGQLDLSLALEAVRVLTEDVENHGSSIDRCAAEEFFEIALLSGTQLVVEHDRVDIDCLTQLAKFLHLARTDEGRGIRRMTLLQDPRHDIGTRGVHKQGEFVEVTLGLLFVVARRRDADDHDLFAEAPVDEPRTLATKISERSAMATIDRLRIVRHPVSRR